MRITLSHIIAWLIAGAVSGTLVAMAITRSKSGFGRWTNIGIGLIGALIGGALFRVLGIDLGLRELSVSLEDLITASIGSLIFLGAVWLARRGAADRAH
jgi:uncharacterized membrane protein YeaQ/YmgE (transglycosylase-associated protein family)